MLSLNHKIEYRCPDCHSIWITRHVIERRDSFVCKECHSWGPWRERIREDRQTKELLIDDSGVH